MDKILVIIPAYNEEGNIANVVSGIRDTCPQADILVVDDGSKDQTANVARSAGVRLVSHPFNLGYGSTIQTGYKYAFAEGYDYLVQIDGDGQHDPAYIDKLLAPVVRGEADFAIGSRFMGLESYTPSLARRAGITLFRTIVSMIIGRKVTDCTSGFQAFNRDVIRFFTSDIFPCDYPDADVLVALHCARFSSCEVPVRMHRNLQGKSMHSGIKPLYYVLKMLLSILVTSLRSRSMYEEAKKCR